ncbi:MAG: patatin family protein [Prevotella sp.]|nr:patatin family protein [Prevotella sp.]
MKTGLVLEGGAMRGLFTAGILDVLLEADVTFDGVVGVSAGAAFGINFVSRQLGRTIRYNKRFAHDWRYCSIRSWLTTGDLFGAEFAYHVVPEHLAPFDCETFEQSKTAYHLVCTDVRTGKAVYQQLNKGGHETYDWVRASASMPMVSKPVRIGEHLLLDGGVADSIPLAYFENEGYERNVVILTQPEGYIKGHNKLMPFMRIALHKYPAMVHALDERHIMYNKQLEYIRQRELEGKALVIRPTEKIKIGHVSHDPDEMQAVYDIGRREGLKQLERIKEFVGSFG